MDLIKIILFLFCPLAAIAFVIRVVCAAFSVETMNSIRRHPVAHWIWFGFAVVGAILTLAAFNPSLVIPSWVERIGQRKEVAARVAAAGGWDAIQRDAEVLMAKNGGNPFFWFRSSTNALPPALAVLKPMTVSIVWREVEVGTGDEKVLTLAETVSIGIFGVRRGGRQSPPFFGLDIISNSRIDKPSRPNGGGANPSCDRAPGKIYEVY